MQHANRKDSSGWALKRPGEKRFVGLQANVRDQNQSQENE